MLEILFFLLLLFLISLPFIPGMIELFRPRDDAPLAIDLEQSSDPREQALKLERSSEGLIVEKGISVHSLCSARSIQLHEGALIRDLVDAEHELAAEKGCNLGKCASSALAISISSKCTFKRLFAPIISCRKDSETVPHPPLSPIDIGQFGWYVNRQKFIIPPGSTIKHNIFSAQDLKVRSHTVIEGSIQCDGTVYLSESVTVKGNIFAKNSIVIGRQCQVLGNIFSQRSVTIHSDTVVGEMGKIKSVIGKERIKLHGGATIYGHILTQGKGYVL